MAAYGTLVSLMELLESIRNHPTLSLSFDDKQINSLSRTVQLLIQFSETFKPFTYEHMDVDAAVVLESRIASTAREAMDVIESQILAESALGPQDKSSFFLDLKKVIKDMEFVTETSIRFEADIELKAENVVTGFDEAIFQLLDRLTVWDNHLLVVPVAGIGGIGKTTLAKNAYQHTIVRDHFDIRLWATISQKYSVENILKQLLCLRRESPATVTVSELREILYKELWGRRYLIVLDDMWSVDAWEEVRRYLPDNRNGSRVVVTTRLSYLATRLSSSSPILMNFLDEYNCWKLFCRKAFGEEYCPVELEELGRKIVKSCGGHPLSIVVIAGHLGRSSTSIEYWEKVSNHLKPISILEEEEQWLEILSFSYELLPAYLKSCLVYTGLFITGELIETSKLLRLWIAEGFLKPNEGLSLEEVGKGYLEDLIGRNLIERRWNRKVECVAMHDTVRELCLKMAKNEKFMGVVVDTTRRGISRENRVLVRFDKTSEGFESTVKKIVAALLDASTYKVGILGVGKTRLARLIGERVVGEELFTNVMMVKVGPTCYGAEDRIAYEIYDYLGMKWYEEDAELSAAYELLSKMVKVGRVLVILDDVWGVVNLGGPGITKDSCKVMIVSRLDKVCLEMGCDAIFKLQNLMEEADVAKSLVCKQMMLPPRRRRFILHHSAFAEISRLFLDKHSGSDQLWGLKHLRFFSLRNYHNLQNGGSSIEPKASQKILLRDSTIIMKISKSPAREVGFRRKNLKFLLFNGTSIRCHLDAYIFNKLEALVITACDTLRYLMSQSAAKNLLNLKYLAIKDCFMMEQVIAADGEEENIYESLFPQLRTLVLKRLPLLKSFCHVTNDLELPSLKYLTLKNCQGMTEFSRGKIHMPVLECVSKDHSTYRIDGVNTIKRLFNDKYLFVRNFPRHSQGQEVKEFMDDPNLYPENRSQASGGTIDDLQYIEAVNFSSISNQNTVIEEVIADSKDLDIEIYLNDFISFCSVLPHYYVFTKDIIVSQWMIGGLIELGEDKLTEEVCCECFDILMEMDYFVPSEFDYIFDQMKYKVGDRKKSGSKMRKISEMEHVSLAFKELGLLKQYNSLQTLVMFDSYGVDHLPSDIFSELKTLKILNLSGTNVSVLPSSIEKLEELRFLDMSKTPIRWLPNTICYFPHLHTLNLDGCLELERLPKCTNKLINLQHLVLDVSRLQSMPVGMGNLSNLRTLNAFSVGVDDGLRVRELKELNELRGSFSLLNLENVESKEDASEACLYKKLGLKKIEFHWSDIQDDKCRSEEEILESLEPPSITQELKISFYSGGVLPSWICDPSFSELVSIVLEDCKYCSSLPCLGELPSLKILSIIENVVLTEIGSSFFGKRANRNRVPFPKLEKLSFDSMSKLEKWTGFEDGDFPSLQLLMVEYCPVFVGIPFLSCLSSLSGLEIRYCPEFSFLPEDGLPPSLESLMIKQSPKLKAQCCDEQWRDRSKAALVPSIYIDDQEFSLKNGANS